MDRSLLQLYFILGSNNTAKDPLFALEQALEGGITFFQFREKGIGALEGIKKKKLAVQMKELCHSYQVPFLINDDVDLALEIGADGIHVGQDDSPVQEIRSICPPEWLIGVSATNKEQAVEAKKAGADYIGVGPIYPTSTKSDAKKPITLKGMKQIREEVGDLPMVAIGGIQLQHVIGIMRGGADGVSVISAISQAENPKAAAKALRHYTDYFTGNSLL